MRIFSLIAVLLFMSSLAVPARAGMEEDGEDCMQNRDLDRQLRGCTAAIRSGQWQGKGLAAAYHNRCWANNQVGNHHKAIEDCNQALRLDPSSASAYINRGSAYDNLGEYSQAIEDFDEALRLDPDDAVAYRNRGLAYRNLGNLHRAIEEFDQALRIDPSYADAYNSRGFTYYNLRDYRRAIQDYNQALRLDPNVAYASTNRGSAYNGLAWDLYLKGRNTEALGDVERSLSDRPDSRSAIETRAHILVALGRWREALTDFERAMRAGGENFVRMYQEALVKHGYYRGAIDGAYGPQTRAALVACLKAGCRVQE
jgi:tetratricopeptide (TPR) repeat protein